MCKFWTLLVIRAAVSEQISWFQLSFIWLLSICFQLSVILKKKKKDQQLFKVPVLDLAVAKVSEVNHCWGE